MLRLKGARERLTRCAVPLRALPGGFSVLPVDPQVPVSGLQVKAWEEEHQGAMEEWAKRCAALEAERKTLAASIEDTAAAFDESLASLAQVCGFNTPYEDLAARTPF